MLAINHITKSYGSKEVLKGIDCTFHPGKIYGIVGKNGAGKTTLFKCLAGLESYEGTIQSSYDHLKNHIGYLQTTPVIMSHITGWEYLKLLTTARGITEDNFSDKNIFDLPLDEYAMHYSTGMSKKLAFLGILLQQNDIFILDEPFNGVDIQSNMILSAIITKLKEQHKTIIISSHIISSLKEICDQIFLLDNGVIDQEYDQQEFSQLDKELRSELIDEKLDRLWR